MQPPKLLQPGERIDGPGIYLRPVTLDDCTDRYVAWLEDPAVNRYLETRWRPQTMDSIRGFVGEMIKSDTNYLLAIVEKVSGMHIGNIKVGPIIKPHAMADISYFIGEKSAWRKGYGTQAVIAATSFAFQKLGLRRLQAGLYEGNLQSKGTLERAGYRYEATFVKQLQGPGGWEDHLWYVAVADTWKP